MNNLKLDTLSECILAIFKESRTLSLKQLAFLANIPMETLAPSVLNLWREEYIGSYDCEFKSTINTHQSFFITPKGTLYWEEKERAEKNLRETRLWKLVPIVISFISLIIASLALYISYLTNLSKL